MFTIQQYIQNIAPALLSYSTFQNVSYLIQEMQPVKDSINFKLIKDEYRNMYQVLDDMAMLTPLSQLRSAGRKGSAIVDELVAFGEDTKWHEAVLNYSIEYAAKTKKDYKNFKEDIEAVKGK